MTTYHVIGRNKDEKQVFHEFAESLEEARQIACDFVIKYYHNLDALILSESFKCLGMVVLNMDDDITGISPRYLYVFIPDKSKMAYGINYDTGKLTKKPVGKQWW